MAPEIIDSSKKANDSDVGKNNDSEFDDVPQTDPDNQNGTKKKKKKSKKKVEQPSEM